MYLAIHVLMAYSSLVGQEHSSKNKRSISLKTLLLFSRLICSKFVGLISDSQQVQIARILTDRIHGVCRILSPQDFPKAPVSADWVSCRLSLQDTQNVRY